MFSNRLKKLRLSKGVSQEVVADFLDISKSAYGYYESGRNMPSVDALVNLSKYFSVSTDYLLGKECKAIDQPEPAIRIPVLGRIPAGIPIEAIEDILDWEELNPADYAAGEYFALRVSGDSMYPEYLDGDVAIIKESPDADRKSTRLNSSH